MTQTRPSNLERAIHGGRRAVLAVVMASAVAMATAGLVSTGLRAADLFVLDEAGYGDSYILYDILHFQSAGFIYRDLSQPPYLPAQYSPAVYMLLSLPGTMFGFANPFLGPRLIVLAAFLVCAGTAVSITRTLQEERHARILAILAVAAISTTWDWILQIRSDFIGLMLSLLAIRLLLVDRRWFWCAGLCAGLALQFKITYVAAGASGVVWLALQRRWLDALGFAGAAAASSLGLYLLYALREPGMFAQMTVLSPGVPEVPGGIQFALRALFEPVVIVAVLVSPFLFFRSRGWQLAIMYAAVSFVVASATVIQAGANINYFFEFFFASVPLAAAGLLRLRDAKHPAAYAIAVPIAFACVAYGVVPRAALIRDELRRRAAVSERNAQWRTIEDTLRPYRTFSTIPRIALYDREPALLEPFLVSYLDLLGKPHARPVYGRIGNSEFDAVVTAASRRQYRGIPHINTALRRAIERSYTPHCVLTLRGGERVMLHLPRAGATRSTLAEDFEKLGCSAVSPDGAAQW